MKTKLKAESKRKECSDGLRPPGGIPGFKLFNVSDLQELISVFNLLPISFSP
jgi:hypothetical protein